MTTAPQADRRTRREAAVAVGGLFESHARMVYGVCRTMLRDVHDAEDATQQVFLSAHQALLNGATVREPGGWLATIARNECRARIAVNMRRPLPAADADLEALPATSDDHARHLHVEELRAALAELPEQQREAFVLRYLYGLRYREVATALGLSRPATEALLFRARRAMRLKLRPVVGAALIVPSVVRDELAMALPGFEVGGGGGVAAAGLTGGFVVKLAAGPLGLKLAAAVVAVSTVGIVGALPPDRVSHATMPEAALLQEEGVDLPSVGTRKRSGGVRAETRTSPERRSGSSGGSGRDDASEERSSDVQAGSRSDDVGDAPAPDGAEAPTSSGETGATSTGGVVSPTTDDPPTDSGNPTGGGTDRSGPSEDGVGGTSGGGVPAGTGDSSGSSSSGSGSSGGASGSTSGSGSGDSGTGSADGGSGSGSSGSGDGGSGGEQPDT